MTNLELAVSDDRILNEGYGSRALNDYLVRAEGCHVWDHAGRKYVDLAMGGGSMILGHGDREVQEAIIEQSAYGSIFAAPHAAVHEMGELLAGILPWFGGFVFCNSGSEAIMRLVRIARAVTGKQKLRKIGLFSGCWHGSWDGTLVEEDYDHPRPPLWGLPGAQLKSAGTLPETLDSILLLPYRDESAFDLIRENKNDLACVLIEPVQGSNPSDEAGNFLRDLRHTTTDCGVLLAFDEVITGFRLGLGGGQEYFGVHGDLAAYGKILGGGLPVGMVAGTKAIMDKARSKGVFFGGTFSANPLTIAAGMAALRYLVQHPETYDRLASAGNLLRSSVNQYCTETGLPAHMMGAGSISRLILVAERVHSRRERDLKEPDAETQKRFYADVRARGVWIGTNRIQFLSMAHGVSEIGRAASALCGSLAAWEESEKEH
ncbi:MAG: aminotransferase class III-fold pyridoxal phosphate-dependent enzyme [Gammaproteobacteria bacterium]|nr:aminotransferase class III-fold pyridoxal phosphate-dependent enzyme [Gammaproteobacteria bacterium]